MKKILKYNKTLFVITSAVLFISLTFILLKSNLPIVKAQTSTNNIVQDSDYDGLSDQAERDVYRTDPLKADTDSDGYLDSTEVLTGSDPLNSRDPADSLATQTASLSSQASISGNAANPASEQTTSRLPWYVTRAAGNAAYVLMFLIVMLGAGMTTSYIYKYINPVKAWVIHKYLSLALGITILTHITALFLDKFINFSFSDIFIPFFSNFKPIFLSLGILGFYVLLIIIFSSLFFRLKYKKTWRGIHYAVYILFTMSLVHGFYIGTDSGTIGMQIIYYSTGIIFLAVLIYRFILKTILALKK